jgi:hypothetical protein
MGTTTSTDISAASESEPTNTTTQSIFDEKDNLRHETLLIPEDIEDVYIEATTGVNDSDNYNSNTGGGGVGIVASSTSENNDSPATNTRYGKGKHWKRNLKKQQQKQSITSSYCATERTMDQRKEQVRPIIDKLTELQLNMSYPAIRELYKIINQFIKTGEDVKIKIPFPEFSRKIKGELSNAPYIPCWVKLENDQ